MLKCVICGEDLSGVDAFVKFNIDGEFFEYIGRSVQASGQEFLYTGVRMCPHHITFMARTVEENLSLVAKMRKKKEEEEAKP